MNQNLTKFSYKHFLEHETKRKVFLKFGLVLLVFLGYLGFISYQYGFKEGLMVTSLTWSFFVLCTPIADAGFLLDFPVRLITKIRMLYSEIFVWILAILLSLYAFFFTPEAYEKTKLLQLFQDILENPIPFWSIIVVSGIGTFMSVLFGDELIDTVKHENRTSYHKHKKKYFFWIIIALVILSIILYHFLLKKLNVDLSF